MKVHINQIPEEGKHIEGEADNALLELHEPEFGRPVGPVHYSLDVGLSDGGLFATGTLAVELEFKCVACLEEFRMLVEVPDFACQIELTGAEMVDLTPWAREDILLALPPHPHCDWNGEKECQPPLIPQSNESDTSSEGPDVWGALDQLKIKKIN